MATLAINPQFLDKYTYGATELRRALGSVAPRQQGVEVAGDMLVAQRAAGTNMSVDVASGRAWVDPTQTARQGTYLLETTGVTNVTGFSAADGTNPRVDQVVARVYDSSISGSQDQGTLEVVTGTPTASAQISNNASGVSYRAGAAALPAGSMRLADVLVPAGSTVITNANIVDRRPWAFGAWGQIKQTAKGSNYSTASYASVAINASDFAMYLEVSGIWPLEIKFNANMAASNVFGGFIQPSLIHSALASPAVTADGWAMAKQASGEVTGLMMLPAASYGFGRVGFNLNWQNLGSGSGDTLTAIADATNAVRFSVREHLNPAFRTTSQ